MRHSGVAVPSVAPYPAEKPDPYATPFHRSLDAALILVTVLIVAFVWRSAEGGHSELSAQRVQLESKWTNSAAAPLIAKNTRPLERPEY